MRLRVTLFFVISSIMLAAEAIAQAPPVVSVSRIPSGVRVVVSQSLSLVDVVRRFCSQTHAWCDVSGPLSDKTVAPLSVAGRWEEVLRVLLSGTGWNYVAVAADTSQTGMAWISEPRPPAVPAPTERFQDGQVAVEQQPLQNPESLVEVPLPQDVSGAIAGSAASSEETNSSVPPRPFPLGDARSTPSEATAPSAPSSPTPSGPFPVSSGPPPE